MHRKICMFIYISIRIHINYPLVIGLQFNSLQTGETVYVTSLFWNLLSHLTVNILRQIFHVFELNIYSVIILFSTWMITFDCLFLLFLRFLFIFRGRERREKERERNISVWEKHWLVASCMLPTGDWTHNPGMCPHRELNQWPFSLWDNFQTRWATPARAIVSFSYLVFSVFNFSPLNIFCTVTVISGPLYLVLLFYNELLFLGTSSVGTSQVPDYWCTSGDYLNVLLPDA